MLAHSPQSPEEVLTEVRRRRALARPARIRKRRPAEASCLRGYRAELVTLRKAGASYPDLTAWLHQTHGRRVAHTTIMRFLAKVPEMAVGRG